MKQHPLITLVVDLLKEHGGTDASGLGQFLGGCTKFPKPEDMEEVEKALFTVAQHILDSMEEDNLLEKDEEGIYRLTNRCS